MPIGFQRPVGPHLDVKELEYLCALHQSSVTLRPDASITAADVVCYLASRHGIRVDIHFVRQQLMPGLAGAFGENPDPVFDLVEITSILLIPHLVRAAANNEDDFFERILDIVLQDVAGTTTGLIEKGERPPLTRELIQAILECYGEQENARNEDIDDMLQAAGVVADDENSSTTLVKLTPQVLARAATSDLKQYKLEWEDSMTTHFYDALQGTSLIDNEDPIAATQRNTEDTDEESPDDRDEETPDGRKASDEKGEFLDEETTNVNGRNANDGEYLDEETPIGGNANNEKGEHLDEETPDGGNVNEGEFLDKETPRGGKASERDFLEATKSHRVEKFFTFASIDYVAENYQSVYFTIILWVVLVVAYFAYVAEVSKGVVSKHWICIIENLTL